MIALWMLYAAVIGCLVAAAAHALEHLLAQHGWSRRWIWLIAMAALPVVPLLTRSAPAAPASIQAAHGIPARGAALPVTSPRGMTRRVAGATALVPSPLTRVAETLASGVARVGRSIIAVAAAPAAVIRQAQAHQERLARLDRPLAWAWAVLSALLVGIYVSAAVTLCRQRRRWPATRVDGEPVLIAPNAGPAVVGLFRPAIVLPAWTLGIDARHRALILQHEREHMRARDPLVLHAVTVTTYLVPWNLAMWWMLRRLRIAVELDCDRRVLLAGHDAHRYADLLLAVGHRRARPSRVLVPALVERRSLLARRILAMCPQRAKFQPLRSTCAAGAAYLMFAAAFAIPMPALKTRPAVGPGARPHRASLAVGPVILADSSATPLTGTFTGTLVGSSLRQATSTEAPLATTTRRAVRPTPHGTRRPAASTTAPQATAAASLVTLEAARQLTPPLTMRIRAATDSSANDIAIRTKTEFHTGDLPQGHVTIDRFEFRQTMQLQDSSAMPLTPEATLPTSLMLSLTTDSGHAAATRRSRITIGGAAVLDLGVDATNAFVVIMPKHATAVPMAAPTGVRP